MSSYHFYWNFLRLIIEARIVRNPNKRKVILSNSIKSKVVNEINYYKQQNERNTMNSIKKSGMKILFLAIVLLLGLNLAACSKDPVSANNVQVNDRPLSGNWEGAFNHPDYYSGYITMDLSQSGGTISGTYHLNFYYGYSNGPVYDGNVTGTISQSGNYNLSLLNSDFTYNCDLTLSTDALEGSWVSDNRSKSGSLLVHRK